MCVCFCIVSHHKTWSFSINQNVSPWCVYICALLSSFSSQTNIRTQSTQSYSFHQKASDMAANVFGNPITDETLQAMPKYHGKTITRCDRAHEALNMIHAESKDVNALGYVDKLKGQYGDGVSTLCVVYNATGDPITFQTSCDWHGHIWKAPYPQSLANGQWGAFLHVHPSGAMEGSSAAVVYRGKDDAGKDHDFMFSWMNPWWRGSCTAYTLVREAGYFARHSWGKLQAATDNADLHWTDKYDGCNSYVSIGDNTTAIYEAKLTLKCAEDSK